MPPYDDDEFSDDEFGLNDIPDDALEELESKAIQFTQAQHPAHNSPVTAAAPLSDYGDDFDDDDLDDNVVIDESRSTPALNPTFQHRSLSQQRKLPQRLASNNAPSHYINTERRSVPPPPLFNQSQQSTTYPEHNGALEIQPDIVAQLRRQLDEVTRERNVLQEDLTSKTGEIAIVRSKQDKTIKEYERELTALRKVNAEALAKQGRELEAARISERAAATERDFLKQDTAETIRARRVAQIKDRKDGEAPLTPRKKKLLAHRDGFDDDEIEFLSPSKNSPNKLRKTSTPTKASKRKRKVPDSPAGPLEVIDLASSTPVHEPVLDEALLQKLNIQDERYDFLGTMFDHKFDSEHRRTIEELGHYTIPSNPVETIQATILGALPTLGRDSVERLPVEFCELILSLWEKCMTENYFDPIYLFVDLLTFALQFKTSFLAPHLIDHLVPLASQVLEPVLLERFIPDRAAKLTYDKKTGSTASLTLLYVAALGCMCEDIHIVRFWKFMRYDPTMLGLSPNQLMVDKELMLKFLSTSVANDSFGAPSGNEAFDRTIINDILSKLTTYLAQTPKVPFSTEDYAPDVVANFRLQILQLMTSMTRSTYASKAMALHRDVIGRLVKLISDGLNELYDYKPGRDASTCLISLTTRLLYHLVTTHEDIINMGKKLSVIAGGNQKYLLSLARLNFSEDDLVLEAGIDPDVATCALELLELFVTPEEGDAIHSAFSSQ